MNLGSNVLAACALVLLPGQPLQHQAPIAGVVRTKSSIGTLTLIPPSAPQYVGSVLRFEAHLVNNSDKPILFVEDRTFAIELYDSSDSTHTDLFLEQRKEMLARPDTVEDSGYSAFGAKPGKTENVAFLIGTQDIKTHPGQYTLVVSAEDVYTKKRVTSPPLTFTLSVVPETKKN